jgi:hypothetical protein
MKNFLKEEVLSDSDAGWIGETKHGRREENMEYSSLMQQHG